MPDCPVGAHLLASDERVAALERNQRIRDDQGGTENKTSKIGTSCRSVDRRENVVGRIDQHRDDDPEWRTE
jgi:hypothetical protein